MLNKFDKNILKNQLLKQLIELQTKDCSTSGGEKRCLLPCLRLYYNTLVIQRLQQKSP